MCECLTLALKGWIFLFPYLIVCGSRKSIVMVGTVYFSRSQISVCALFRDKLVQRTYGLDLSASIFDCMWFENVEWLKLCIIEVSKFSMPCSRINQHTRLG